MKPIGVIGEKKMEDIIYDITLTEAIIYTYDTKISTEERKKLYNDIYAKIRHRRSQIPRLAKMVHRKSEIHRDYGTK